MEPHNEIRKNIPIVWNNNQINVVDRIRKDWKFTEFEEDEIHTVCGILEVRKIFTSLWRKNNRDPKI